MTTPALPDVLPVDRGPDEVIESADINTIAQTVNALGVYAQQAAAAAQEAATAAAEAAITQLATRRDSFRRKKTSESRLGFDAPVDPQLAVPVEIGGVSRLLGVFRVEGPSDGDFKMSWDYDATAGTQIFWTIRSGPTSGPTSPGLVSMDALTSDSVGRAGLPGVGTPWVVTIEGLIVGGTKPDVLRPRWGQNQGGATAPTSMLAGSFIAAVPSSETIPLSGDLVEFDGVSFRVASPQKAWSLYKPDNLNYGRFELRPGDQRFGDEDLPGDRERIEVKRAIPIPLSTEVWWAMDVKVTGDVTQTHPSGYLIFNQIHQAPESAERRGKPPSFNARITPQGRLQIHTRGDTNPTTLVQQPGVIRYDEAWTQQAEIMHFVFRSVLHWTAGELEVWKDGEKIVDLTGICNAYNDTEQVALPRMALGQYRSASTEAIVVEIANVTAASPVDLTSRILSPLPWPV